MKLQRKQIGFGSMKPGDVSVHIRYYDILQPQRRRRSRGVLSRVRQYLRGYGYNSLATGRCVRNLTLVTFTLISRTVAAFRVKLHVVNDTRPHRESVTISSVNGLVSGDNPLSETMLTKLCVTIWCQKGPMSKIS